MLAYKTGGKIVYGKKMLALKSSIAKIPTSNWYIQILSLLQNAHLLLQKKLMKLSLPTCKHWQDIL